MQRLSTITLIACFYLIASSARAQTPTLKPQKQEQQSASPWEAAATSHAKFYVLRLRPGQDLRRELERFTQEKKLRAGFIVTGVGSLNKASLRLADQPDATNFAGKFEIVSLVGTLTPDGPHLHLSISDKTGKTIGGHLVAGCEIYTTAEIVIGDALGLAMTRELDLQSGYQELKVRSRKRR